MISTIEPSEKTLSYYAALYKTPNPATVALIQQNEQQILADAQRVADFVQLVRPDQNVFIRRDYVYSPDILRDGTIRTCEVYVEGWKSFSIYLCWNPGEARTELFSDAMSRKRLNSSLLLEGK